QQTPRELGVAPSARCLELEDFKTLRRREVRPVLCGDALEASAEEVELAMEQSDLGLEAVVFAGESDACNATVDSPAAGESNRCVGEANGAHDARADVLRPAARQGQGFRAWISHRMRQPQPL